MHTFREAGPSGIEPETPGLKARCSILAELRAHKFTESRLKQELAFFKFVILTLAFASGERQKSSLDVTLYGRLTVETAS